MAPSRKVKDCWTLVQHSAYGYGSDGLFAHGVEVVGIHTMVEKERVEKVGGFLFSDYKVASAVEHHVSYKPDNPSLYPKVDGTFSRTMLNDLQIYIPTDDERAHYGVMGGISA